MLLLELLPQSSGLNILFFVIGIALTAIIGALINSVFNKNKEDKLHEDNQEKRLMLLEIKLDENFKNDNKNENSYTNNLLKIENQISESINKISIRLEKIENSNTDMAKDILIIKEKLK